MSVAALAVCWVFERMMKLSSQSCVEYCSVFAMNYEIESHFGTGLPKWRNHEERGSGS